MLVFFRERRKELLCFLSQKLLGITRGEREVYSTHLDHVLTPRLLDIEEKVGTEPCSQEVADTLILYHALTAAI